MSSGTSEIRNLFQDLWRQLGECHRNALQELEEKVSKLKKERSLDAQKLELYYNRNKKLKEESKALQDAVSVLEERLRGVKCDRCAILEDNLKNCQDHNERHVNRLKREITILEDENSKLHDVLQKLNMSHSEPDQSPPLEQEEGIIPDSPVLPGLLPLPLANKLKRCKNPDKMQRVRYTEIPQPKFRLSLLNDMNEDSPKNTGSLEVLAPNTCEIDGSQISNEERMAELNKDTCGLPMKPQMALTAMGQQSSSKPSSRNSIRLKPYNSLLAPRQSNSPDSTTEMSKSFIPHIKRFSEDALSGTGKRKKDGGEPKDWKEDKPDPLGIGGQQQGDRRTQPEPVKQTPGAFSSQSLTKENQERKVQVAKNRVNMKSESHTFKKPSEKMKENIKQPKKAMEYECKSKEEHAWSIDPALAMSLYDPEWNADEEEQSDNDCTLISHSVPQHPGENKTKNEEDATCEINEKANDSLDLERMFETTAHEEYQSCCHPSQSQEEAAETGSPEQSLEYWRAQKAPHPTFAHVAVVRKKDERRKLKGTTCKECEIYYAHLPGEEKEKKLSACSRHRFLYIPPSTPENFWEVGFPSTQTCIERGYIKEEKSPVARLRRRQPYTALFSSKQTDEDN